MSDNNKFKSNKLVKEGVVLGHCDPITKDEIFNLFEKENSMCKIYSKRIIDGELKYIVGSGFFLLIEDESIPFRKCLITNNHILNKDDINENCEIKMEYLNKPKTIKIISNRLVFTNEELDYTCIELLEEDNFKQFFNINKDILEKGANIFKDHDIFILQYPGGGPLSFSSGKIIEINGNIMKHNSSTHGGSSGSPIICRKDLLVLGLHFGSWKNKYEQADHNESVPINLVLNDIKKIINSNYITGEIYIDEKSIDKEILIINSLYNEEEIKKNCLIEINDKNIKFSYSYKFDDSGIKKIKYKFKKSLTKTNHMFFGCSSLINLDLSNFYSKDVENMSCMFYECSGLKSLKLNNFNTVNVEDMSSMFSNCSSLISLDLNNFNTGNVKNMSCMFYNCSSLISLYLNNFI